MDHILFLRGQSHALFLQVRGDSFRMVYERTNLLYLLSPGLSSS
jgi:hypothetical protein